LIYKHNHERIQNAETGAVELDSDANYRIGTPPFTTP
jgi:hypothetical protein